MNAVVAIGGEIANQRGAEFRSMIFDVQNQIAEMPQVDMVTNHHFAGGIYARELHIPAGCVIVGKLHKHDHPITLSSGSISVSSEFGNEDIEAPRTWTSKAGIKRLIYAHEDAVITTYHATNSTDLEEIEREVIAESYDDLGGLKCLG